MVIFPLAPDQTSTVG